MANEVEKIALVTGGTGDIGGAYIHALLENGYEKIFAPVRNLTKMKSIFDSPNVIAEELELEDEESVRSYLERCSQQGLVFDLVVLATGDFKRDDEFNYIEEDSREKEAKRYMANCCFV